MNKKLYTSLVKALLVSQIIGLQVSNSSLNAFTQGAEVATALLRGPAVILAKKAESDKKFKKARLLGATADFIRMTNDLFALYNLYQKDNQAKSGKDWYKWTKVMWIGQDFSSLLIKVKNMVQLDSVKLPKISSDDEKKMDVMLTGFLKKLDLYILPSFEGAAAVLLSFDNAKKDSQNGAWTLSLQAIISGSRLLSEMLEAESGSIEQKLVIACSIIHAVILLHDLMDHDTPVNHDAPVNQVAPVNHDTPVVEPKVVQVVDPVAPENLHRELIVAPQAIVQQQQLEPARIYIHPVAQAFINDAQRHNMVNLDSVVNQIPVLQAPVAEPVAEPVVSPVAPEVEDFTPDLPDLAQREDNALQEKVPVRAHAHKISAIELNSLRYHEDGDLGTVWVDGERRSARLAEISKKDYKKYFGKKASK